MILLKDIKIDNFLSHEQTQQRFEEEEKTLIDGASGSGKSSFFDAIVWCLFGVGRADNRSLIRKGATKASVTLGLRDTSTENPTLYRIERTITSTGKHSLTVTQGATEESLVAIATTGVRPIQHWIEHDLIGASHLLFVNSVAYVQGNQESFVAQNAPRRKELLLEIVKAADYDDFYEKAKDKLNSLGSERQRLVGQVAETESILASLRQSIDAERRIIQYQDALAQNTARLAAIEKEETILNEALSNITAEVSVDTSKLHERLNKATSLMKERSELHRLKPPVRDRTNDIANARKRIASYRALAVCPAGGQCPYSGDNSKHIEGIEDEIRILEIANNTDEKVMGVWQSEWDKLPEPEDINTIAMEIATAEEIRNSARKTVETSLRALQREKIDCEVRKAGAIEALEQIKRDQTRCMELERRVAQIKTSDLPLVENTIAKVELAKEAFGSKGIKTVAIDYLLPRLEDKINEILSQLSEFRIHLDTQKATADGDGIVEGLWITIINETGQELPYESYSGGEKLKIQVAISEALASLQKVGFRMFDEAIVALDENSEEGFVEVLQKLQKGFPQVMLISHLASIKDLFEKRITCVKHGGVSHVQ